MQPNIQPVNMQPNIQPVNMQSVNMQPTMYPTMQPNIQPVNIQPVTMQPVTMQPNIQPVNIQPVTMQPNIQPVTMQPVTMQPNIQLNEQLNEQSNMQPVNMQLSEYYTSEQTIEFAFNKQYYLIDILFNKYKGDNFINNFLKLLKIYNFSKVYKFFIDEQDNENSLYKYLRYLNENNYNTIFKHNMPRIIEAIMNNYTNYLKINYKGIISNSIFLNYMFNMNPKKAYPLDIIIPEIKEQLMMYNNFSCGWKCIIREISNDKLNSLLLYALQLNIIDYLNPSELLIDINKNDEKFTLFSEHIVSIKNIIYPNIKFIDEKLKNKYPELWNLYITNYKYQEYIKLGFEYDIFDLIMSYDKYGNTYKIINNRITKILNENNFIESITFFIKLKKYIPKLTNEIEPLEEELNNDLEIDKIWKDILDFLSIFSQNEDQCLAIKEAHRLDLLIFFDTINNNKLEYVTQLEKLKLKFYPYSKTIFLINKENAYTIYENYVQREIKKNSKYKIINFDKIYKIGVFDFIATEFGWEEDNIKKDYSIQNIYYGLKSILFHVPKTNIPRDFKEINVNKLNDSINLNDMNLSKKNIYNFIKNILKKPYYLKIIIKIIHLDLFDYIDFITILTNKFNFEYFRVCMEKYNYVF
jgi:hypothetical protein